jgi:hypothetical protein
MRCRSNDTGRLKYTSRKRTGSPARFAAYPRLVRLGAFFKLTLLTLCVFIDRECLE